MATSAQNQDRLSDWFETLVPAGDRRHLRSRYDETKIVAARNCCEPAPTHWSVNRISCRARRSHFNVERIASTPINFVARRQADSQRFLCHEILLTTALALALLDAAAYTGSSIDEWEDCKNLPLLSNPHDTVATMRSPSCAASASPGLATKGITPDLHHRIRSEFRKYLSNLVFRSLLCHQTQRRCGRSPPLANRTRLESLNGSSGRPELASSLVRLGELALFRESLSVIGIAHQHRSGGNAK